VINIELKALKFSDVKQKAGNEEANFIQELYRAMLAHTFNVRDSRT